MGIGWDPFEYGLASTRLPTTEAKYALVDFMVASGLCDGSDVAREAALSSIQIHVAL